MMFENIKSDSHWWKNDKIAEKIRITWLWAFIYVTKGDVFQKKKEQLEIKTAKENRTSKDAFSFISQKMDHWYKIVGSLIQNSAP